MIGIYNPDEGSWWNRVCVYYDAFTWWSIQCIVTYCLTSSLNLEAWTPAVLGRFIVVQHDLAHNHICLLVLIIRSGIIGKQCYLQILVGILFTLCDLLVQHYSHLVMASTWTGTFTLESSRVCRVWPIKTMQIHLSHKAAEQQTRDTRPDAPDRLCIRTDNDADHSTST